MANIRVLEVSCLPSKSLDPVKAGAVRLHPDGTWEAEVTNEGDGKAANAALLKFLTQLRVPVGDGSDETVTAAADPQLFLTAVQKYFARSSSIFLAESVGLPKKGLASFLSKFLR